MSKSRETWSRGVSLMICICHQPGVDHNDMVRKRPPSCIGCGAIHCDHHCKIRVHAGTEDGADNLWGIVVLEESGSDCHEGGSSQIPHHEDHAVVVQAVVLHAFVLHAFVLHAFVLHAVVHHCDDPEHVYPLSSNAATALHALITPLLFVVDCKRDNISSGQRVGSILSNNATTLTARGDAIEVPSWLQYHHQIHVLRIDVPGERISAPAFENPAFDPFELLAHTEITCW